jgi:hypothetical protein
MKKYLMMAFVSLFAVAALSSCDKFGKNNEDDDENENNEDPTVEVETDTNISVTPDNVLLLGDILEVHEIQVATEGGQWEVSANVDWIYIDGGTGVGYGSFSIHSEINPTTTPRTAVITVTNENQQSVSITVTQAGGLPYIYVPELENDLNVDYTGLNVSVYIESNTEWTVVSSEPSWCSVVKRGADSLTINVDYNSTQAVRTASITLQSVDAPESEPVVFYVRQDFLLELAEGEIELSGFPEAGNVRYFLFYVEAQELTVDWGDGTTDTYGPNGERFICEHTYAIYSHYSIFIRSKGLTVIEKTTKIDALPQSNTGSIHSARFGVCSTLEKIDFSNQHLTSIDVSGLPNLKYLNCEFNRLGEINVENNPKLTYLSCLYNERIEQIDVSHNPALTHLYCNSTAIERLDVSNNVELTFLQCGANYLTELDVSRNIKLDTLECGSQPLRSLDLSKNTKLRVLDCTHTHEISSLDLSNNPELVRAVLGRNRLSQLDVSNNPNLRTLQIYSNNFTVSGLNALFSTLPVVTSGPTFLKYMNNPGTDYCDSSIATSRGWHIYNTGIY